MIFKTDKAAKVTYTVVGKTDRTYVYRALRVKFTPSNFIFDTIKQFCAQLKEASVFLAGALLIFRSKVISDFGDNKRTDYLKGWVAVFGKTNRVCIREISKEGCYHDYWQKSLIGLDHVIIR